MGSVLDPLLSPGGILWGLRLQCLCLLQGSISQQQLSFLPVPELGLEPCVGRGVCDVFLLVGSLPETLGFLKHLLT